MCAILVRQLFLEEKKRKCALIILSQVCIKFLEN